ncbi:MAG: hypothetical protein ACYC1Q_14130 [Bacteroidia bacterium]
MKTKHVMNLLKLLADGENQALDHHGFQKMSEAMYKDGSPEVISPRYLYDLYRKTKKKLDSGIEVSSPRAYHINLIAKHLGYPSFGQYETIQETKVSPTLKACAGIWWSYVRANAGEKLFKAPVRIFIDENSNQVNMEMRTKGRVFKGLVHEDIGCLTSYLDSGNGKKLAVVFKLGNATNFELLQGVFSGISSAGDPISGREILVRETGLAFDAMHWEQVPLADEATEPRIRNYFSSYGQNCLKIKEVSSFSLSDLELTGS